MFRLREISQYSMSHIILNMNMTMRVTEPGALEADVGVGPRRIQTPFTSRISTR